MIGRARDLRRSPRSCGSLVLSRASLSFAYPFASLTLPADRARRPVRAARDDPAAAVGGRASASWWASCWWRRRRTTDRDAIRARGGARRRHRQLQHRRLPRAMPRVARTRTAATSTIDVLVIDNASHDGSHRRAVAAHPWARLIENPENVLLSPAWNQGVRETAAPFVLLLNPDAEWWTGTLADYVDVARAHPRAGIVGPMVRNPDGTVYASGRSFPERRSTRSATPSSARSHPDNRVHAAATTWTAGTAPPSARSTGSRGCCMLMPREAFDEVGPLRRGVPPLRRGARPRHAAARRRLVRALHARRSRSSTRSASRPGGRAASLRCTRTASTATTASTEPPDGGG